MQRDAQVKGILTSNDRTLPAIDRLSNMLHRKQLGEIEEYSTVLAKAALSEEDERLAAVARLAREICFWAWGTP